MRREWVVAVAVVSMLTGQVLGGPVDGQGRPLIRKLGTIDCDLVETTPVVFKGRLYRCEWVRTSYEGNELGENYWRLVDVETGEATNINNSDIDCCEYNGRLVINYSWGNQKGKAFPAEAVYEGTEEAFLTGWFPADDSDDGMEELLVIEPGEEYPRHSEGDIAELKDGRLCLIYTRFTGGAGDHATADLVRRVLDDGGKTWSQAETVVRQAGGLNVMSVSLLRLASGEIALFYLRKTSREDCRPVMSVSTDEGQTWSEPAVCIRDEVGYYVLNNDRAVQLKSGRLVLPVAWHQGPGKARDNNGVIMCYLSDDKGQTWRRSEDSFKGYAPSGERVLVQEPGVIELNDGRLMMWMRTQSGSQYVCHSRDGGETWSKARPSDLASPRSPASIERVPWTGELVCVWNDHSGRHPYPEDRRTPLCVAVSKDEGKTWSASRVIEGDLDGWYCYTSITFVGDRMLLAYCAGDREVGGLNRLKVAAISKDWLASTTVGQD